MTIPQPFVSASFYFNLPTITKYDGSLASQFTKLCHLTSFPEGSPEYKNYFNCDIKADAQGSIYGISSHFNSTVAGYDSTGYLESNQYFANNKVIGNSYFGGIDFQIVKYTPNGIPIWVKTFGSSSNDFATAMDITPQGEVFITGYISGNATFGNLQITGNGGKDMFILKITE